MRICLDFTSGIGDPTGVGTYTRELARALLDAPGGLDLVLAVHAFRQTGWHARVRAALPGCDGRYGVRANRLLPHGALLRAERLGAAPAGEDLFGATDVFHGTNFLLPPLRRARGVVTVHDLAFLKHPDEVPVAHRYRRHLAASLGRADRVIAVSEATRQDLLDLFPLDAERVAVVTEGGPSRFPLPDPREFAAWRTARGIPERYLLFVGTLEPRKNLERLVRAYLRARPSLPAGTALVLAGRRGWHDAGIREAVRRARRTAPVLAPGFVPEAVRNGLLAGALAFVFPSRYEGFGLPVLEAFRARTPVLAGDAGALPEVAGDAALLVPPRNEAAIADALVRISGDEALRADLVARGTARLGRFTWERTARETREVYERA